MKSSIGIMGRDMHRYHIRAIVRLHVSRARLGKGEGGPNTGLPDRELTQQEQPAL